MTKWKQVRRPWILSVLQYRKVFNPMFYSKPPPPPLPFCTSLSHSFCLAAFHSNAHSTSPLLWSLFVFLVNSSMNHPLKVTGLLSIVIWQLLRFNSLHSLIQFSSPNVHQAFLLHKCRMRWILGGPWFKGLLDSQSKYFRLCLSFSLY